MEFKVAWGLLMIGSGIVLVIKILTPSVVQVVVDGSNGMRIYQIPNVYTLGDIVTICLFSISFSYAALKAFLRERIVLTRELKGSETTTFLKQDELKVYKMVERSGLVSQTDIGRETGLTKSKISIIVDILEAYGLIEKKKKGRENLIVLAQLAQRQEAFH